LAAQAPRGAAVMLRVALETIVSMSGSQAAKDAGRKNLASGLGVMADEGALDRNLASWAREIRTVGNAGAHHRADDRVTQDEAADLGRLTRQLMHYIYELPAQIRRSREG
jgi:hypothetical protein